AIGTLATCSQRTDAAVSNPAQPIRISPTMQSTERQMKYPARKSREYERFEPRENATVSALNPRITAVQANSMSVDVITHQPFEMQRYGGNRLLARTRSNNNIEVRIG